MQHDVFISYSYKDGESAAAVCGALEAAGVRCWMAPRDVPPGKDWRSSITEAIEGSRATVLVLSENSNTSPDVHQEVGIAFDEGKPIIPLRLVAAKIHPTLRYCLNSTHWVDALSPPLTQHLPALITAVAALVSGAEAGMAAPPREEEGPVAFGDRLAAAGRLEEAVACYRTGAEKGDNEARYRLGKACEKGSGVPLDVREAARWYELAAEGGSLDARCARGHLCLWGLYEDSVEIEYRHWRAAQWFQLAAEQGHAESQYELAWRYCQAVGVERDCEQGLKWYRAAAEQDFEKAQYGLAFTLEHGKCGPPDHAEAARWYRKSAEKGNEASQYALGNLYHKGLGVPRSETLALLWLRLAAEQKHHAAQKLVADLTRAPTGSPG